MKYIILKIYLLLPVLSIAQQDVAIKVKLVQAKEYLKGASRLYNPEKAFELYKQCAEAGNGEAINALGIMYARGIGTPKSDTEAFHSFRSAADKSYPNAYYNLALSYKNGRGTPVNYGKAYEYFGIGATAGLKSAVYGQAYMLYKGLGCQQDYKKASALFAQGAYAGQPASMYFLGLSYRNGYGVALNTDSAYYWLDKASKRGYQQATDEINTGEPENVIAANGMLAHIADAKALSRVVNLPIGVYSKVTSRLDRNDIAGSYKGYLVKYDFSGSHIVEVEALQLQLIKGKEDSFTGLWKEQDSIEVPVNATIKSNKLVFMEMDYKRKGHYEYHTAATVSIREAEIALHPYGDSLLLEGNLTFFNQTRNEPDKPFKIILAKSTNQSPKAVSQVEKLVLEAFPNPFDDVLNLRFKTGKTYKVTVQLFSTDGRLLFTQPETTLNAGSYVLPLRPVLPSGAYLVKLRYGNQVVTTTVVKK